MELSTVARCRNAFLRLVGTDDTDSALTDLGEAANEVVDLYLTRGCRDAQRWMLKMGYDGWRKRSSALTFTGTDAADGGQKATLPSDFMRTSGNTRRSALREASGDSWGAQIDQEEDSHKGNYYYLRGTELWLARTAVPPTTVYLDYHYQHPTWTGLADGSIDFPLEVRPLIIAEAANVAKEENWLPGGRDMEAKIERALARAREAARDFARQTKGPRTFRKPVRWGNHWALAPLFPLVFSGQIDCGLSLMPFWVPPVVCAVSCSKPLQIGGTNGTSLCIYSVSVADSGCAQATTTATLLPAVGSRPQVSVCRRELVSVNTVCLDGVSTALVVDQHSNRFCVQGIYTVSTAAQVVQRKPVWDGSDGLLIGEAVRPGCLSVSYPKATVPIGGLSSNPEPTSVWKQADFSPETFSRSTVLYGSARVAQPQPAVVVQRAPTTSENWSVTRSNRTSVHKGNVLTTLVKRNSTGNRR